MVIYNKIKIDIGRILRKLCEQKGMDIIESEAYPDYIYILIAILSKYSVAQVMGYLKGKSSQVSKKFMQCREEDLKRIISEEGCQLRMNRSIQVEGSFGNIKQDMGFRRYLSRGKQNATAESILLAMAHNINKLHRKIQSDRTGNYLFDLKTIA